MTEPGLRDAVAEWRPGPVTGHDVVSAQRVALMAATLDVDGPFDEDTALPPMWQWAFFLDWPSTAELGADGHPRDGHFLPPIPHRRRMFAGGRVKVNTPLLIGRDATRRSEITDSKVKHGRTGELLFVTVRHSFLQGDAVCVEEEQDVVYRSDAGASTSFTRDTGTFAAPTAPWSTTPVTSAPLLFRFSAVTGNTHRIHYDEPYTTGVEGYPGLVVHGPLLAVYMAELVRTAGRTVREFAYRLQRPAFVGDPLRVEGTPDGSAVELSVGSGRSTVHATATAVLE